MGGEMGWGERGVQTDWKENVCRGVIGVLWGYC